MAVTKDLLWQKYFTFNGKASADFRLICSGGGTYNAPKRSYETIQIPGRNGCLLQDNGYYEDVTVKYDNVGFIPEEYYPGTLEERLSAVRDWLLSPIGYCRLEDTWHPGEYRMGYLSNDFEPNMLDSLEGGTVDLEFTCKPQRWLKLGEEKISITSGTVLYNPTGFESYPIINVTGSGTVTIKNSAGTFSIKITKTATVDCDLMDSYNGSTNLNSVTTFTLPSGKDKIFLAAGENTITFSGFSAVAITPRWWRL